MIDFAEYEPEVTPESEALWAGLLNGKLVLTWCDPCDAAIWIPRALCPVCLTPSSLRELSGGGEIYSLARVHRGEGAFAAHAPYVVAYVTLDEGLTVLGNIVDEHRELRIGDRVRIDYSSITSTSVGLRFSADPNSGH